MATSYSSQAQTQAPPSLRDLQKKALLGVLNLNAEEDHDGGVQGNDLVPGVTKGDPVWKFLVFDKMGQDIISSVLRVSDLREAGVTVHMQLKADRLQMEDVPASTQPTHS
jgi:sec1 family domain-containing protein 1